MKSLLSEFKDFINKGNVVIVAVAFVMGLFFQQIINALIDGIVMPIIAAILGEPDFGSIGFFIGGDGEVVGTNEDGSPIVQGEGSFVSIGLVLNAVIVFIAVAIILFLVVKAYNRYMASPEEDTATEIDLLTEIRDELRTR